LKEIRPLAFLVSQGEKEDNLSYAGFDRGGRLSRSSRGCRPQASRLKISAMFIIPGWKKDCRQAKPAWRLPDPKKNPINLEVSR
jgi:hypothetical protein